MTRRNWLRGAAVTGGVAIGSAGLNAVAPALFPETPAFDPNHSLWMRAQAPHNPPLTTDAEADVVVIGAGYTGLSAAYHIRKRSPRKSVIVVEARGAGNGASGRNGAMLLPNVANEYLRLVSPPELHKRIYDLTVESMRNLEALAARASIPDAIDHTGALEAFASEESAGEGREYVEKTRRLGIPVRYLDREGTAALIGTRAYAASVFDPNAGHVHPMKLVRVVKEAAEAEGVRIYEDSSVRQVEEGAAIRLHMAGGQTVKARAIVLATNAFTSKLGYFRNTIAPVYNYVAVTRPLTGPELASTGWAGRMPFNDSRKLVHYLGRTADGRIHIGGGPAPYDWNNGVRERSDGQAATILEEELLRLYPSLRGVGFEMAWNGMVDMTLDWAPLVGSTGTHNNVFYGLGYCGHGVNLTFLFGRIIADLEAGGERAWAEYPFVNRRAPYLPNEPFRWLGIRATSLYYRFTDR